MKAIKRAIRVYFQRVPSWLVPLVISILVLAGPWWSFSLNTMSEVELIAITTLVVSGLNLTLGLAGEMSFVTVAMYGFGAYFGGIALYHGQDLVVAALVSVVCSVVLSFVIAVAGLRLSGWGLAMISFFLLILLPDLVSIFTKWTGGLVGLTGIAPPKLFGVELTKFQLYLVIILVAGLWLTFMRMLVTSNRGISLRVLRTSPTLATSLGLNVTAMKLTAAMLSAVPAALAGTLYAALYQFVSPDYFNMNLAILIIAASIIGGRDSVYGAAVGAGILVWGQNQVVSFQNYAFVAYGVFLVLAGVFFAKGLSGLGNHWLDRLRRAVLPESRLDAAAADQPLDRWNGRTLTVDHVTKKFGGVVAVDDVSIHVGGGQVLGLIGANGSGKTTLLNLISGFYPVSSGSIALGDQSLIGLPPHSVARAGVSRTFQTPLVPEGLNVLNVVANAFPDRGGGMISTLLRLPRYRRHQRTAVARAARILDVLGLSHLAFREASSLSLGSRRLVEVARAVANGGSLVLLDEPASGLEATEVDELGQAIRRLRERGATVVLVEHNFDFVCDVADELCVLALGKVVASGPPEAIRHDPEVVRSYLGGVDHEDETVDVATDVEAVPVTGETR